MDELNAVPRARLSITEDGAGLVIGLVGELDIASLPDIASPLEDLLGRAPQPMCLDLGELHFLDSSGVTMLVRIANHFDQIRTTRATEPVRRVLEVLGLRDRLGLDRPVDGDRG
jgi:anti-sigma B factor antagonist